MNDPGVFRAHALQLAQERIDMAEEMRHAMAAHNNPKTAAQFEEIARHARYGRDELKARFGEDLPELKPWEFAWPEGQSPEAFRAQTAHYLMTPFHALQLALAMEKAAYTFYRDVAARTYNPEIRRMSVELAEEEARDVERLEAWAGELEKPDPGWDSDVDAPQDM